VRKLVIACMVVGSIWVGPTGGAARQDGLLVEPSIAPTDSELAGLFPATLGGQPVVVETWSGAEWVARLDPEDPEQAASIAATESLGAAGGTTLDEVDVASASVDLGQVGEVQLAAVRVPGARAYDLVDAAVGALAPPATELAVGWGWADEAWIAYYLDRAVPEDDPVVVYPAADTVWVIDAQAEDHTPLQARVELIVEALPPQLDPIGPIVALPQRVEVPALGISASFPDGWDVEVLPMTAEEQGVIGRSTTRFGIDAEWKGTVRAVGPVDPGLRQAPMCQLMVFAASGMTPAAWVDAVKAGNRCYLIDETPAGLVRARIRPGDCGRDWAPSQGGIEHYALGRGDDIVYLNCFSKEPPGERASAIAQSIELLPAEK
jgi:hypothetical protein